MQRPLPNDYDALPFQTTGPTAEKTSASDARREGIERERRAPPHYALRNIAHSVMYMLSVPCEEPATAWGMQHKCRNDLKKLHILCQCNKQSCRAKSLGIEY